MFRVPETDVGYKVNPELQPEAGKVRRLEAERGQNRRFDRSVTVRLNGTLVFAFNKSEEGGVGSAKNLLKSKYFLVISSPSNLSM